MRERDPSTVLSSHGIESLKGILDLDHYNRDYAKDVLGGPRKPGAKYFEMALGKQLQQNLPDAHIMKAFNTVAKEALDTSVKKLRETHAQVFAAGLKPSKTRAFAIQSNEEFGFEAVDLGDAPTAMRVAEAMEDAVMYIMVENKKGGMANIGIRFLPPS